MNLWDEIFELIGGLWDTGNWVVRAAILSVFVPPLVALLFALFGLKAIATAVALTPLLVLVFLPLAMIDPLVIVVVAGALGLHPTAADVRQWIARWIPLYVGSVLVFGVYLFFVPISRNRVLVLPLIGAVGAVAFLKLGGVPRWVTRTCTLVALGISIAFFFSGDKEEAEARERARSQPEVVDRIKEFVLNAAGEERDTVETRPGSRHIVFADRDWILVSALANGTLKEYRMRAGQRSLNGGNIAGLARVRALTDNTRLRFQQVR